MVFTIILEIVKDNLARHTESKLLKRYLVNALLVTKTTEQDYIPNLLFVVSVLVWDETTNCSAKKYYIN